MKRGVWLLAMLEVAACSGSLPDGEIGTSLDPQTVAYAIAGVHASPETVHFTGLPWLLNSTEATGPIVITTHVGTFVLPAMTTTVTGVTPDAVAHAVGYTFSERRDIIAVSSANVSSFASSRLEAYASFNQTLWEVTDPSSGAVLGTGASFDPSGVFFQTVPACHVALPDMGLSTFVPGCENLLCGPPPGLAGPGRGDRDAGAAERQLPGFFATPLNPLLIGGPAGEERR